MRVLIYSVMLFVVMANNSFALTMVNACKVWVIPKWRKVTVVIIACKGNNANRY